MTDELKNQAHIYAHTITTGLQAELVEKAYIAGAQHRDAELLKVGVEPETWRQTFIEVIEKWKGFWMNQKQNSEADYQNYLHRAIGVDANMKYHLAGLLRDSVLPVLALIQKKDDEIKLIKDVALSIGQRGVQVCKNSLAYSKGVEMMSEAKNKAIESLQAELAKRDERIKELENDKYLWESQANSYKAELQALKKGAL